MFGTGLWTRIFAALVIAVVVPIALFVGVLLFAESVLENREPVLVALSVVLGIIVWAALLAVVYERTLAEDLRAIRWVAERGEPGSAPELGAAYRQVTGALAERERQVATLATGIGSIPIDKEPVRVVGALVELIRSVMSDPTWTFAILASDGPQLMPRGVYGGPDDGVRELDDLVRWASVTLAEAATPASRLDGPWGAFFAADVRVMGSFSGLLIAPWEGRSDPTPAEAALTSLVAQSAATALDHSLLYARVRAQAADLNRMASVQADFLRGVTHDLQTPLTSIRALATELRAEDNMPATAVADLDTIAHQADRLRRMVGQLLVASRLEAGVFTPSVEVFAVPPLIERTWAAMRGDRPFDLSVQGPPQLAVADPDRVEQVLWALLDNAVKYSPPGSPVTVTVDGGQDRISITVRDQGAGMDEVTRAHAFDQFYRSDQARRLAPDGSGVGLYAARGMVEAMGGQMSIESSIGSGAAITVELPAEDADADVGDPTPAS